MCGPRRLSPAFRSDPRIHPRRLLVILILTLAFGLTLPVQAQQLELLPDPADGIFTCPEVLTVELVIDAAVLDLRGVSLIFEYDPAVLQPLSVSPGALVGQAACGHSLHWLDPGNNDGSWEVDLALLGCSVDGPGGVLTLMFEGLAEGTSTLDAAQSIFRDSINDDILVVTTPIEVTHVCPVPIEIHTFGTMKALY